LSCGQYNLKLLRELLYRVYYRPTVYIEDQGRSHGVGPWGLAFSIELWSRTAKNRNTQFSDF